MQIKKLFNFIFYFFLYPAEIFSQQYPFINYTPVDGLVNNYVRFMHQDSKGRLYFLTLGGLSVYDGARFINYSQAEGLMQPVLNDVLEITPDSLWVATNTSTLHCLVRGKIKQLSTSDGFNPVINQFFKSADGSVYAAADEGLFIWQNGRFISIPLFYNGEAIGKYLVRILEAGNFLIILINPSLGDDAGSILMYDKKAKKDVNKEKRFVTNCITASPEGDVWASGKQGICVLKKEQLLKGIYKVETVPEAFSSIQHKQASLLNFDEQGQVWVSIYGEELLLVKPWTAPVTFTEASGLTSTRLSCIFHDREGNNWIIPEGKGAQKLMSNRLELLNQPFGISGIYDLYADINSDSVWSYSDITGQLILAAGEKIKKFPPPVPPIARGRVVAKSSTVFLYGEKRIYRMVVTPGGLISDVKLLCEDTLRAISNGSIDPNGNFIYCPDNFVRVFIENKTQYDYPVGYFNDQVAFDQKGRLWIALRSNRLLAFSLHPEDPNHYLKLEHDLSSQLNFKNPRSLAIDIKGNIWIGTRFDGLYCFQFYQNRLIQLHHLTRKEGLTDNFINYLSSKKDNTIWASSPAGLDKLKIIHDRVVIENITQSNNLFLSLKKIMADKNGTSWGVGESGAVLKVYEKPGKNLKFEPTLYISQIKTGEETYTNIDSVHTFSYHSNTLQFSLAAPSFYDEKEIKYSYLLEGSGNSEWSEPSNIAEFNFVNLSPGSYSLKVKAAFPAARYDTQFYSYPFKINPPWWQTIWFRVLAGLFVTGLLFFLVRNYYRQKFRKQRSALEKQQLIEKERTRIATDMHDDLGAGLSRIKYLSESIQFKKGNDESITNDVIKIAGYSDEMVEKMGEIVWALNEKNDTVADLVAFTRSYSVDYLSNHKIKCIFLAPESLPVTFITGEMRRNIFLSVKESLHNVVKHARAGTVTIEITIDKKFQVVIHDDGVGIDRDNIRPFSNGLTNIQKRMEEVGGKAEFENMNGAKVILNVPFQ